jgi:hypothetical protein
VPKSTFAEFSRAKKELREGQARRSARPFTVQERKRKASRVRRLRSLSASVRKALPAPTKAHGRAMLRSYELYKAHFPVRASR